MLATAAAIGLPTTRRPLTWPRSLAGRSAPGGACADCILGICAVRRIIGECVREGGGGEVAFHVQLGLIGGLIK